MGDVVNMPPREAVMEPMPEHLEIAQLMLDGADAGLIQRSWVHAVACAMTTEYRAGYEAAQTAAALSASPSYTPSDAFFEGMARAMCQADEQNGAMTWDGLDKHAKNYYRDRARAAWAWQATAIKEGI